jgi:hypothetical protein
MRFGLVHMNAGNLTNAQHDQAAHRLEVANRLGTAHRLEGSRFAAWQVCRLAASGSRERSSAAQLCRLNVNRSSLEQCRWVKVPRWVTLGSRLQPSYRTATLIPRPRDGSPPSSGDTGQQSPI